MSRVQPDDYERTSVGLIELRASSPEWLGHLWPGAQLALSFGAEAWWHPVYFSSDVDEIERGGVYSGGAR